MATMPGAKRAATSSNRNQRTSRAQALTAARHRHTPARHPEPAELGAGPRRHPAAVRADRAQAPRRRGTGRQEPSANPERAPEHQPGYEAKHQKEAKGAKQQDDAHHRSQADDSKAEIEANDDLRAQHDQKANRTRRRPLSSM